MVHITSVVIEKKQFNHFPIISLWELSVAMATNHHNFSILNCPYSSNICTKLESYCFSGIEGVVIWKKSFFKIECCHGNQTKWPLVIKHTNWIHNHQMIICQIWFTSLHWLWRKYNLTIFPLYVYGSFLLPWQPNQEEEHHNFSYFE